MAKRPDGIWQNRENAALKAAGLNPDTSYGCSSYDVQSCALQGTLYGRGGDEVTQALNDVYGGGKKVMELQDLPIPKEVDTAVYFWTFSERYFNNKKYCVAVCNLQSFQRKMESSK
jgi:hypothetical protein